MYLKLFQLPSNTRLSRPSVPSDAYCRARQRLRELGLPEKRTVILAPESVTIQSYPFEFWRVLSEELRRTGWMVCYNGSGAISAFADDVPVISYPLVEAIPIAELAGWVISMRSGLCDLISAANCRLSIIYPKQKDNSVSIYEHFSLKKQGLSLTAEEFEADTQEDYQLFAKRIISGDTGNAGPVMSGNFQTATLY